MDEKYALSIDFGTQSVRAIIFNEIGSTMAEAKIPYVEPYFSTKPGYAEQNADFYLEKLAEATKKIKKEDPELFNNLIGTSISCFRDTAVILDENHKPIRPAILWLDQRRAECKNPLPFITRLGLHISGMNETVVLNRKRTVSNWLIENEPANWAKMKYYWNISTYFIYKLTGAAKDTASSYTGHYPINMKKRRWEKPHELTYPVFAVSEDKLPTLCPAGSLLGKISAEGALLTGLPEGLPVYGGGGDKSCETLGVGITDKNAASISYGTACTIEAVSKKYHEPEPFLPAYASPASDMFDMEVQIYRGYWMLEWFAHNFANEDLDLAAIEKIAVEEVLNQKMMAIPPGSDGLILQPYWGPGLKRPLAKGAILGFSDYHTKYHLYRAIVEGIGYALREGLESIQRQRHSKVSMLRVSGGGSKSSAICQITADIFNLPVSRIQTYETASLGCAIIVFVSSGVYKSYDEAVKAMVHEKDVFYPNKQDSETYDKLYKNIYKFIYPRIKLLNFKIRRYNNSTDKE
jgi:sugar (pentulose or hexulose) kinase